MDKLQDFLMATFAKFDNCHVAIMNQMKGIIFLALWLSGSIATLLMIQGHAFSSLHNGKSSLAKPSCAPSHHACPIVVFAPFLSRPSFVLLVLVLLLFLK